MKTSLAVREQATVPLITTLEQCAKFLTHTENLAQEAFIAVSASRPSLFFHMSDPSPHWRQGGDIINYLWIQGVTPRILSMLHPESMLFCGYATALNGSMNGSSVMGPLRSLNLMEAAMSWKIGGTFCECTECGRQFMGPCKIALYDHMVRDHGLSHEAAGKRTADSIKHNVIEEYFNIPGIG